MGTSYSFANISAPFVNPQTFLFATSSQPSSIRHRLQTARRLSSPSTFSILYSTAFALSTSTLSLSVPAGASILILKCVSPPGFINS